MLELEEALGRTFLKPWLVNEGLCRNTMLVEFSFDLVLFWNVFRVCKDFVVCWWEYTMLYLPPKKKYFTLESDLGDSCPFQDIGVVCAWNMEMVNHLIHCPVAWTLIFSCFRVVRVFGRRRFRTTLLKD